MSSIEFEEPEIHYRTIDISHAVTHNMPFLIKHGIVKDLRSANKTMLIITILLILSATTIYILRPSATQKKYKEDFTATELEHMHPDMVNSLPLKNK